MKRSFCMALLAALLLTYIACPAIAEPAEITIDVPETLPDPEFSEPELFESEVSDLDLPDLDLDGALLLNDPVPESSELSDTESEDLSATASDAEANASSNYKLNISSISIGEKEKYRYLTVDSLDNNGTSPPEITWRSANKKIAKVNSKTGKVTGVKKGTTTIYAKIKGVKKELKCKVTVLKAPKKNKFSVTPKTGSLRVGQTGQFTVKFDKGYGGSVSYESSDENIATVDESGMVTAIAVGKCKIKVTTYNDISKSVTLQVLEKSSDSKKIEKVLAAARKKLGKPYVHGKRGSESFDCVGFTYWCYKQVNVKLKNTPTKQAEDSRFTEVTLDELRPGDLMYFCTDDDPKVSHAALYLGDGELIHASYTAGKVIISDMGTKDSNYYRRNFVCGRRVFD